MKKTLKLETDLLKISQPYGIVAGDSVRDIDPRSPHYNSVGKVMGTDFDGNITYRTTNMGKTFKVGTIVVKKMNQLMKIIANANIPIDTPEE